MAKKGVYDKSIRNIMETMSDEDQMGLQALVNRLGGEQSLSDLLSDMRYDPSLDNAQARIANTQLARSIQAEPGLAGTNLSINPAAYLAPQLPTYFSNNEFQTYIPEQKSQSRAIGLFHHDTGKTEVTNRYLPGFDSPDNPQSLRDTANTIAHENIHRNTAQRGALRQPEGSTPYLRGEITEAARKRYPELNAADINYGALEPLAWAGAQEALDKAGQLPIQEEMDAKGLGNLYGLMVTHGPIATEWNPTDLELLKQWWASKRGR